MSASEEAQLCLKSPVETLEHRGYLVLPWFFRGALQTQILQNCSEACPTHAQVYVWPRNEGPDPQIYLASYRCSKVWPVEE